MKRFRFCAAACGILISASSASAATITFDTVASGTVINTAYQSLGVTFNNPIGGDIYALADASAASPGNVVSVFGTGLFGAFDARWGAVEAVFTGPVGQVSIDAAILRVPEGLGTPTNSPKIEIYRQGVVLPTVVSWNFSLIPQPGAGGITGYQTLAYVSASDDITKVRILSGQPGGSPSNFGLFDNLTFSALNSPEEPPVGVPEPSTLLLLGIAGTLGVGRRLSQKLHS